MATAQEQICKPLYKNLELSCFDLRLVQFQVLFQVFVQIVNHLHYFLFPLHRYHKSMK